MARRVSNILQKTLTCLLFGAVMSFTTAFAQDTNQVTQEHINDRIAKIFKADLLLWTGTTPEGYQYNNGKVYASQEEYDEVKKFGDRAIASLAEYFAKNDDRAQLLAIRFLVNIGGARVLKILTPIAEKSPSPYIRFQALANLQQYPWPEVADLVRRIAANDENPDVKAEARKLLQQHE